nr:hypothetical protein Iba_chr14fCG7290 [Ipomoea batatas]
MVEIWESVGADKQRKLKISKDLTRKNSTSFIIYPPMTPRTLPAPTLPYRVENWTVDAEAQPSKTWVLQTGLQHVDYSSALPTLRRRILEGKASWNQHPSFKGEFSFTKGRFAKRGAPRPTHCLLRPASSRSHFGTSMYSAAYQYLATFMTNMSPMLWN